MNKDLIIANLKAQLESYINPTLGYSEWVKYIDNLKSELSALESEGEEEEECYEKCDVCGSHPSVIIINEFGRFCKEHVRYI